MPGGVGGQRREPLPTRLTPGSPKTHIMSSYRQHLYHIKNQQEHHKKISFEEEYRNLLFEYGITPDEKYFP